MNKKVTAVIIATVLIVSGGCIYYYKVPSCSNKTNIETKNYIISTAKKSAMSVNVQSTGTAYVSSTRDITGNNEGTLHNLNVGVGSTVKKGDKLFSIYSNQLQQQLNSAEINYKKEQLQLSRLKSLKNVSQDDIDVEKLEVNNQGNNLYQAQQNYNNMWVTSPMDGVVTAVNYSNEDNIPSGKSVLTITTPNSMKVKANIDELDISKIKIGQNASIAFNAIDNKTYKGTVESIADSGTTTNNVTTYEVIISLEDTADIKAGMTANIDVQTAKKDDALVVPIEALTEADGKYYITLKSTSDTTSSSKNSKQANITTKAGTKKEVQIGLKNDDYVEIVSGISEGDKVLTVFSTSSSSNSSKSSSKKSMNNLIGNGTIGGGAPNEK